MSVEWLLPLLAQGGSAGVAMGAVLGLARIVATYRMQRRESGARLDEALLPGVLEAHQAERERLESAIDRAARAEARCEALAEQVRALTEDLAGVRCQVQDLDDRASDSWPTSGVARSVGDG